jgi:SAM-dependent methyltransferase
MNINKKLLSFRYKKNFLLNRNKRKKIKFTLHKNNIGFHISCPICSGVEGYLISEVDRIGFPCDTVICKECDFVFNNSYISNPNEFYETHFGADRWGDPEINFMKRTSSDSFSWKRFSFLLNKLNSKFTEIEKILEIGCGDGCNLMPYHLIGKSVSGCDFSLPFLEPGLKRGLNLIHGNIDSIKEDGDFDLIMLIHSFEHVMDLDTTVQSVSKRLRAGGYVFVEVPGIVGWNQTREKSLKEMGLVSSNNFLQYLQFEHNYHFSLKHLKLIWERNGFELVYGDEWVRAIFRKKDNKKFLNEVKLDESLSNIFGHLKIVENDFLKFTNLLFGFGRKVIRKFSSNN